MTGFGPCWRSVDSAAAGGDRPANYEIVRRSDVCVPSECDCGNEQFGERLGAQPSSAVVESAATLVSPYVSILLGSTAPVPLPNNAPKGKSNAETIRCLKRYVAREIYNELPLEHP